ncbi:MAG: hypothetical protein ABFD69_02230 [Candidatus Sumerlaeia bacterium]
MEKTAVVAGLMITVMGLIGIIAINLSSGNGDEAIAITGAIIFGAGLISRAIGRKT